MSGLLDCRSGLGSYFPAALDAFLGKQQGLARPEARAVLSAAPTPARAARLTRAQLRAALKRAGRTRGIDAEADRLRTLFRGDHARQPQAVEDAMGLQLHSLIWQLDAACVSGADLATAVEEQERPADLRRFPLGLVLAASLLRG